MCIKQQNSYQADSKVLKRILSLNVVKVRDRYSYCMFARFVNVDRACNLRIMIQSYCLKSLLEVRVVPFSLSGSTNCFQTSLSLGSVQMLKVHGLTSYILGYLPRIGGIENQESDSTHHLSTRLVLNCYYCNFCSYITLALVLFSYF